MDINNILNNINSGEIFLFVIAIVGVITSSIIFSLISIKSVIDVFKSTGIFPEKWIDTIYQNEDERIKRTLKELGLLKYKNHYESYTKYIQYTYAILEIEQCKSELNKLVKNYTDKKDLIVGDNSQEKVSYYVNLRKCFFLGKHYMMVDIMHSFILKKSIEGIPYDCIISRKGALDLLGFLVAEKLNVPFVVFNEEQNIRYVSKNSDFAFDYIPENVENPIVVDDSMMGGTSVQKLILKYKEETGISIKNVFVLFTRKESSISKLKKVGAELHYLELYNDKKLKEILKG